jgi:hypothetical protein
MREQRRSGSWWLSPAVLDHDEIIDRKPHDRRRGSLGVKIGHLDRRCCGLCCCTTSMAVGEYGSLSAERDSQQADIDIEQKELADLPRAELNELAMIVKRELEKGLAIEVAWQLSAHDLLGSHLRDEPGIETGSIADPFQAARRALA